MIEADLIGKLLEANETARKQAAKYPERRLAFEEIFAKGRAFVGIAGLRGIGKTVMLKQKLLDSKDAFYISLDNYNSIDLFETAKKLNETYGIKELLLDEINYCKNWQQGLKKIFDFLEMRVFFTSSVAIDIINSRIDLSRRAIVRKAFPFSFREFILFYKGEKFEKMKIADIKNTKKLQKITRFDILFKDYIQGGLIPAFLEEKNTEIFSGILERIIEKDLVFSLNFNGEDIQNVKTMLEFIANSGIDDVSYSSISKNIGITKYKAMHYVQALEKAFVLNVVKPKGSNVVKEPKILFVPLFPLR